MLNAVLRSDDKIQVQDNIRLSNHYYFRLLKFRIVRIVMLCFLLLTVINLNSQLNNLDSLTATVDEISITANRLDLPFSDVSRSISVITQREISQLNVTSVNEVLQTVAGIDLRQRGANGVQADLSIRGGTFEQSLVLIDGVRVSDPQTGHHLMNLALDIQDIERIEIIKGPAARVFGQNAFAGAVNIITKMPKQAGGYVGLEYGTFNMQNTFASIALPVNNYAQKLSAAYRSSDGYRFNTDYKISNLLYQSRLALGSTDIDFKAGYVDRDFGANSFYGNENFIDQYETVQTTFVSAASKTNLGSLIVKPRISYRKNKDNWQFRRQDPEFFQNFHTTDVWTAEVHNALSHKLGNLGFGLEYNYLYLDSSNLKDDAGTGEHTRHQVGFHIENRFLLADDKLDITPGLMILNITDYGTSFYPGLDLGYVINNQLKAFVNFGQTTRIPTYTDLYYQDSGNAGNPNLEEETAFTYELGLKYLRGDLQSSISFFNRRAMDQIDWFRLTEDDKWTPDNFNTATYRGIDVSVKQSFSDLPALKYLSLGYTYLDATFEDNDFAFSRNQLENLKHQLIVNTHLESGPVSLNLLLKYNDRVSLENYTTVNATLSYAYKKSKVFLRASNLFDAEYRETNLVQMPGRWMSGGVRVGF